MSWNRTKLMYRKSDHEDWSGRHTCTQLMSSLLQFGKQRLIDMDDVKLDVTDLQYDNDTAMLENQMGDYSSELK